MTAMFELFKSRSEAVAAEIQRVGTKKEAIEFALNLFVGEDVSDTLASMLHGLIASFSARQTRQIWTFDRRTTRRTTWSQGARQYRAV
jgi:hypothetical protein